MALASIAASTSVSIMAWTVFFAASTVPMAVTLSPGFTSLNLIGCTGLHDAGGGCDGDIVGIAGLGLEGEMIGCHSGYRTLNRRAHLSAAKTAASPAARPAAHLASAAAPLGLHVRT